MGKSSSESSYDGRRKHRKSHKKRRTRRGSDKGGHLEESVKFLTDTVLKIGKYLDLKLDDVPTRRSRSTSKKLSRSRSHSPISRTSDRSRSPSINTPLRRSRSPFSVPRGENEEARKEWATAATKSRSAATKAMEGMNSPEILIINAPDDPLIKLLGTDPGSSNKAGIAFHEGVASRWQEIAKSGVPKEERDTIKSKFRPPPNCEFGPPALNAELTKAIFPIVRSRDEELGRVQGNLQVSVSGLGNILSGLLNEKEPLNRTNLISGISDVGRFLVGTQYSMSLLRRRVIKDNVKDTSIKELLHETPIYPNLFEADLGQKIKQMQTLAKVGSDITKPGHTPQRPETRTINRKSDSSRNVGTSTQTLNSHRPLPSQQFRRQRSGRPMRK